MRRMSEKNFMKKITITLLIVVVILSFLSYKIMQKFQETNEVDLSFNIIPKTNLSDLRVNLFIMRSDAPSEWYSYYKTITVIDKGIVLTNFKSKYILAYQIEGGSKLNKLHFDSQMIDNVFARKENYKVNYTFGNDFVSVSEDSIINLNKNKQTQKYLTREDNIDFKYYDPNTTEYQVTDISEENLLFLNSMPFNDLKNVGKIKSKDIFKLNHLKHEEKIELVKIHDRKKFDKPLE